MARFQIGLCTSWDICHLIYLTPTKFKTVIKRLGLSSTTRASKKTMERFRVVLDKARISLHQDDGGDEIPLFFIYDPFWQYKLETAYA